MHLERVFKGSTLLLVDLQSRLAPAIPSAPQVVARVQRLIGPARRAGLPIFATEQYSRGLGHTLPELRDLLADEEVIEKIHFSAAREADLPAALAERGATHCYVAGTEAHVCVLQSVLVLLSQGIAVTLLEDAVASRVELSRRVALARMARAGAKLQDCASLARELAAAA